MKKTIITFAAILILFTATISSVYAQEVSSTNIKLIPSQERIPQPDQQPRLPPELFVPPIESYPSSVAERKNPPPAAPVSKTSQPFKAPLITSLERGKWYVQIGAYTRAGHVEDAVNRAGTASPVVIHSVGTVENPMFRVLLGPFSQSESKTTLQRFKAKGYDAFLRSGN
ncbi:MAG: SPOR domain-containing protein [Treponema sp.]|jgi:cell division septation protein DedD|nr:SPOR domain-containing protein [Treponema sp.]